ncbi:acetyltransferase [Vibrio splendidus]|uniref:acetyltransferase n=1 Tax=Vibrio splendidus TaxID=29497 RepID=UPI000C849190|nr:acetyltransferase [Vibrio splendidus]MBU2910348.1 DHH family phosphoesterase [Vibrio splendidus]MDO6531104.1 DHH family phosphoesterase [Vibrio splendidus]MDO6552038.1 DHH family phosphoesterase [Vibrio splendidus]PMG09902.1 acetyltransferase [Vibrio splendidus]
MHYDVFNGDADGIIALLQLRLAQPKESVLVTGVKRDIKLLNQLMDKSCVESLTVLDISMEKNQAALSKLLECGVDVFYCDHHRTGDVPTSENLTVLVNLSAETCTSLLINQYLDGQYAKWAVVAAFGDNMIVSAKKLAVDIGLSIGDVEFLKELGTLINYNSYGASIDDLHIEPVKLYKKLLAYSCPLMLKEDKASPFYQLKTCYELDYANVLALKPIHDSDVARVFELPCETWARRISGVLGNELANQAPDLVHAVLTLNQSGYDYTVSVRAPLNNRIGADEICSSFPTGGGRKAAAGINKLYASNKSVLIEALNTYYE